jgi:hypothetical protein
LLSDDQRRGERLREMSEDVPQGRMPSPAEFRSAVADLAVAHMRTTLAVLQLAALLRDLARGKSADEFEKERLEAKEEATQAFEEARDVMKKLGL